MTVNLKTKAIILLCKNMFEKDKILTAFSENLGKIKILAKSANTAKFKFGGLIEPINLVEMQLYKGQTFLLLSQCDLIQTFPKIRTDLNKINLTMYFFDIINKASEIGQVNKNLFHLLEISLNLIEKNHNLLEIQHYFQEKFLQSEGLLGINEKINNNFFTQKFEDYCHKKITKFVFVQLT